MNRIRCGRAACRLVAPLLAALALHFVPAAPAPAATDPTSPFAASFRGTFTLTFFTGPDGTHELRFHGSGRARHLGRATVDGYSTLRPVLGRPTCNEIVDDEVTLTAADGSTVEVVNEAIDCLEFTPDSRILIHGKGTYEIVGGSDRFAGSSGAGSVSTEAEVTGFIPSGVHGRFDPLSFSGGIRR